MTRRPPRGRLGGWLAATLALLPTGATAQTWPQRPIRLLVPFTAGGATDLLARAVASRLSEALGQQVVADNRPGANGIIAFELTARAAPDGHTLLMGGFNGLVLNPLLHRKLPYDPVRELAPVALVGHSPLVVVVHPTVPARTMTELVEHARGHPDKLVFSSGGIGNVTHVAAERFMALAGIRMRHVPYKGGAAGIADQLAGQTHVRFDTPITALPHVRTGRLRALAVTSRVRLTAAPELPTVAESGYPDYQAGTWFSIVTRNGVPATIIARVNREIQHMVAQPPMREQFAPLAIELASGPPEALAALVREDTARWGEVIRRAGIGLE